MTLDIIKKEIEKASSIVILTHENPDGDAIGSSLAMYIFLKDLGKNVDVVLSEFPRNFKYLPLSNEIKHEPTLEDYDLAISVDAPDIRRLGKYSDYFENATVKITIDHHSKNSMFGDYNFVNPVSPACCQIIASMFDYWKVQINKDMATCLLTGIITDTGGFKNSGVTAETFEFAAKALVSDVNVSQVYKKAMMTITKTKFELQKIAMDRLELLEDGKIAFTYITKADDEKINIETGDHDGIVEIGRNIEGVEVSIFLHERQNGFKVSFRSNDYVNVADICLMFGGGGHIKASGCTIDLPLEEVKQRLILETKKHL